MALAMQTSCFSPALRLPPSSLITVSRPSRVENLSLRDTLSITSHICSLVYSCAKSIFSLSVPLKRRGS